MSMALWLEAACAAPKPTKEGFQHKIKRIIGGHTYNTATSTEIVGFEFHDGLFGQASETALFKTRKGVYFLGCFQEHNETSPLSIIPLTPERVKFWLERHFPNRPEIYEGEFNEQAKAEARFTLRMTNTLKKQINSLAKAQQISINKFVTDCLEKICREQVK
tara:strand:- start:33 stop:518 length:486 start_codon:yes stop_codon:yes gene_type:complete